MQKMIATVLEVNADSLLVCDCKTNQEVLVFTNCACNFQVDDKIMIIYNGIMTRSLPPQINAIKICKLPFHKCC
ncbi:MAG: hypothetical protein K2G88_07315 [Oscillospiraceae bacterium]|nr:hypothetical protein [Oscillospiraceae bacterium]